MREDAATKAGRYLTEGRIIIRRVTDDTVLLCRNEPYPRKSQVST